MDELSGLLVVFVPLLLILFLANLAEWRKERNEPFEAVQFMAYAGPVGVYLVSLCAGLSFAAFLSTPLAPPAIADELPSALSAPWLLSLGLIAPALVGLLILLPSTRRWLASLIPIDSGSVVHAVALSLSMLIIINLTITLGIGLENLSTLIAEAESQEGAPATSTAVLWLQQLLTFAAAVVGVGWPLRRRFSQTMQRLAIVPPSVREIIIGLAGGVGMVGVVLVLEVLAGAFGFGADPDVEKLTEQLLGPLFGSPFGIFTLGVAAALGEETVFRGAAQPRFGLLLTALLFALVHSNYGITFSTVVVFLLGLVLGWVRIRHNTTTAMLLHATYNITLGIIGYLGLQFLQQGN